MLRGLSNVRRRVEQLATQAGAGAATGITGCIESFTWSTTIRRPRGRKRRWGSDARAGLR